MVVMVVWECEYTKDHRTVPLKVAKMDCAWTHIAFILCEWPISHNIMSSSLVSSVNVTALSSLFCFCLLRHSSGYPGVYLVSSLRPSWSQTYISSTSAFWSAEIKGRRHHAWCIVLFLRMGCVTFAYSTSVSPPLNWLFLTCRFLWVRLLWPYENWAYILVYVHAFSFLRCIPRSGHAVLE